jgi:glycosyltransferase involved in cell wall biosynthesis
MEHCSSVLENGLKATEKMSKDIERKAWLTIVMPVYNEVETVSKVIDRVINLDMDIELIVVDDGSTDGTREVLKKLEQDEVRIVFHEKNKGKGAAVRTGYQHAKGEFVTIQDADLELNPDEIPSLLKPLLEGTADVVYGSRFVFGFNHRSKLNAFANWFLSGLTNILYGTQVRDMEACYKVFRTELLTKFTLRANRFDFEPEITAKLSKMGLRIVELPVSYKPREFTDGKKIHWKDGFEAIYTLVKYRFID